MICEIKPLTEAKEDLIETKINISGFLFQNGFTPRGALADYPRGHTACELEKRI